MPARKPPEGMASWQGAWGPTDLPRARCKRAVRVSVAPRVGLCCPSQSSPAVDVLTPLLALLGKPSVGMLKETDQIQAHEELRGTPTGPFPQPRGHFLEGVGAFTPRALRHQGLESGALPWDGGIQTRVPSRTDVHDWSHLRLGLAQGLPRTLGHMRHPLHPPSPVCRPLHGAVIVDATPTRPKAMPAHGEASGAERDAMVVHVGRRARGCRVFAPAGIEGNDRRDGFCLDKVVNAMGIEPAVIDHRADRDWQRMRSTGFEEAVQTGRPQGEVGDMGRSQPDMEGQGMVWGDDTVLDVAMAEKVGIAVGIVPPCGGRIPIKPFMITAEDALGTTVTGGAAVGARARGAGGAVAAEDEGLEIPQNPALDRGKDPAAEEQVFQAGQQLLGAGLVCRGQEFLGEPLGHCVCLAGIAGLGGVPLRLFSLEVAPLAALAQPTGAHAVCAGRGIRPIFQPVDKGIKGANRRRFEG